MIDIKNLLLEVPSLTLNKITLHLHDHEYFVLLGPTGSGKSLLLDIIAGAYSPESGKITLDGRDITHERPESREIGYVPQDYALFDNMKVIDNLTFGLRVHGVSRHDAYKQLKRLIKTLELEDLLEKRPEVLSGGEKRKVALARALATSPKLLLLDEPFSGLDQNLKDRFIYELKRIHDEYGIPTIHVTHNRIEAIELGDRVGILQHGTLEQVGKFDELINAPKNEFIAKFLGIENVINSAELNRYLNLPEDTTVAFTPEDVVLLIDKDNGIDGIPVAIQQVIKLEKSLMITGLIFENPIKIKSNANFSINGDSIKIKIKKYRRIL